MFSSVWDRLRLTNLLTVFNTYLRTLAIWRACTDTNTDLCVKSEWPRISSIWFTIASTRDRWARDLVSVFGLLAGVFGSFSSGVLCPYSRDGSVTCLPGNLKVDTARVSPRLWPSKEWSRSTIWSCERAWSWTLMTWCPKVLKQIKQKQFSSTCQRPGAAGKRTSHGKFLDCLHQWKTWSSGMSRPKLIGGQMQLTTIERGSDEAPRSTRQFVKRTSAAWLDCT